LELGPIWVLRCGFPITCVDAAPPVLAVGGEKALLYLLTPTAASQDRDGLGISGDPRAQKESGSLRAVPLGTVALPLPPRPLRSIRLAKSGPNGPLMLSCLDNGAAFVHELARLPRADRCVAAMGPVADVKPAAADAAAAAPEKVADEKAEGDEQRVKAKLLRLAEHAHSSRRTGPGHGAGR
jgi:hypothetical protein